MNTTNTQCNNRLNHGSLEFISNWKSHFLQFFNHFAKEVVFNEYTSERANSVDTCSSVNCFIIRTISSLKYTICTQNNYWPWLLTQQTLHWSMMDIYNITIYSSFLSCFCFLSSPSQQQNHPSWEQMWQQTDVPIFLRYPYSKYKCYYHSYQQLKHRDSSIKRQWILQNRFAVVKMIAFIIWKVCICMEDFQLLLGNLIFLQ